MPVTFRVKNEEGYFIAKWEGNVTDSELLSSYKQFVEGEKWSPSLNELTDLSDTNFDNVSSNGLKALGDYAAHIYKNRNRIVKTAAICPRDLPYGITRVYIAWSDESPENVKIFRERHAAEAWLTNK